jgi:hypothetical protein
MAYGSINVDTLTASTGVLATQNGMTGIAKAWVNFNGSGGVASVTSFNVSSVTRASTGLYTVNFTTAMPDANYVITGYSTSGSNTFISASSAQTKTTSAFAFYSLNSSGAVDGNPVAVAVFGN